MAWFVGYHSDMNFIDHILEKTVKTRKPHRKINKKDNLTAYLFIFPMLIGVFVFNIYAFFQNIYYSFNKVGAFDVPKFIGLDNYRRLFSDPIFYIALKNTFFYTLLGVPLVLLFSVSIAWLLNQKIKGQSFYRTAIFLPAITMPAAIGLLWRWLLNYQYGLLNYIIVIFGGKPVAWLGDSSTVKWSILLVLVWSMVSYQVIIMLAGLQNISKIYYEAAEIDGANKVQIFFKITLPLLSPTIFFVTIMSTIGILQIFDFIFLMIQRTAVSYHYSMSLVSYFYDLAFTQNLRGYASAIAMVLFAIILVITIIQFKMQKKWVNYD